MDDIYLEGSPEELEEQGVPMQLIEQLSPAKRYRYFQCFAHQPYIDIGGKLRSNKIFPNPHRIMKRLGDRIHALYPIE